MVGVTVDGHRWDVRYGGNTVWLVVDDVATSAVLDQSAADRADGLAALRSQNAELRAALDTLVPNRCEWETYPSEDAKLCVSPYTRMVSCWDGEAEYTLCDEHAEVAST
jgi:hypothetical protein